MFRKSRKQIDNAKCFRGLCPGLTFCRVTQKVTFLVHTEINFHQTSIFLTSSLIPNNHYLRFYNHFLGGIVITDVVKLSLNAKIMTNDLLFSFHSRNDG